MSPDAALQDLLLKWRQLTELEGQAICDADWDRVAGCQHNKKELQPRIAQRTSASGAIDAPQIRLLVNELISLELRNGEWLSEQRHKALEQKRALEVSSRRLRSVHSAYRSSPESIWSSFS